MKYVILYLVIAAFVAALLKVCLDFDPDNEEDLGLWTIGTVLWPLTILVTALYLLYKLFVFLIRFVEKNIKKLIITKEC